MIDPDLHRRNMQLGWALFGLALLLFAGTFAVALIYIALSR
jgi:geranylgeranyl pyrophosphate synthase